MFTIGDFARLGGVSARMLRHYDAIGLLRPAHVDPDSGYRLYGAAQLQRLNRVIALKDLGFTLDRVQAILDESITVEELHGMLRLRRSELEAQMAADAERLARVEARLRSIEREGQMTTTQQEITVKEIEPIRVAVMSGHADGYSPEHITPVVRPLFEQLGQRLASASVEPRSLPIAYYEDEGDAVLVNASIAVEAERGEHDGFAVVDLPRARAATLIHHGSMDDCLPAYDALARWIEANGLRSAGVSREVTLSCDGGPENWVTELQVTLAGD